MPTYAHNVHMSTAEALEAVPEWTFGDRLRKARRVAGLSQAELADALGVSTARLSNWEAGYNLPRDLVRTANAAGVATGVATEWLLGLLPEQSRCFTQDAWSDPMPGQLHLFALAA